MICTFCERNFSDEEIELAVPLPSLRSHSYLVRFRDGQIHQFRRTQLNPFPAGAFVAPQKPPEPECVELIIDTVEEVFSQPQPKTIIYEHENEE
jgi:hypothetical protein